MAIDPILPLSGVGDGIVVARTEHAHSVQRRQGAHEDDQGAGQHARREAAKDDDAETGIWVEVVDEAEVAGIYDDHGRGGVHEVEPEPHRHLDTTA